MHWLNLIIDEVLARHEDGEIIVSSGVSPSGTYHLGTLREVLTAEILVVELQRRGRQARHLHVVDDHDVFRKVPVDVPESFSQYLGKPLCEVPAPDGSNQSYADYFLSDLLKAAEKMKLQMEVVRSQTNYQEGMFTEAIERTMAGVAEVRSILEEVSGRKLEDNWSPIQVIEDGYLKNRPFVSINTDTKTLIFVDKNGENREVSYANGDVKLNWRIDWPARWWTLGVDAEPFGRDHATKGGSYDTGKVIADKIFGVKAPVPVPYNFINRTGDTKKMSKSAGDVITASDLLNVLPSEIVWYFLLRSDPSKLLFFDQGETLIRLFDEFAELLAKPDKSEHEKHLLELCLHGVDQPTVSNIPFSHLVASYQASLRNADATIEVIARTEHAATAQAQAETIKNELQFIDKWLDHWAPEDVKFSLLHAVSAADFSDTEKAYLAKLADKIAAAPADADGPWFHLAIYDLKDELGLSPKDLFSTLYRVTIGKTSGPRAGWFLSILPRDWLVQRLRFEA